MIGDRDEHCITYAVSCKAGCPSDGQSGFFVYGKTMPSLQKLNWNNF
ncbi:hypothetical protein MIZ03_4506 [Rhodoferax lithotrophicus]|uniref:Uncharacterized protein n=1 Tax=Rhodoferax lithotrophicus TaxID=2798804 RepID=A0ABM7MTR7_9BURK|nr:hypothetical protein MIZ03_4506 [Rhodoferax sp. MIZ03]